MYATIRWRDRGTASPDELARDGQALAARLGALPGFLACLQVATEGGGGALVCLCEDRASLAEAEAVVACWGASEPPAPWVAPARQLTGEVVAQKGL